MIKPTEEPKEHYTDRRLPRRSNRLWLWFVLIIVAIVFIVTFNPVERLVAHWFDQGYEIYKYSKGAYTEHNLPGSYISTNQLRTDVLHYDMRFDLYHDEELLKGDVTITGLFRGNVNSIDLNLYENMTVSELTLNGEPTAYNNEGTALIVEMNDALSSTAIGDTFRVNVKYSGTPTSIGFGSFEFTEHHNMDVIYTLSEPVYASTWFPCSDRPDDKAFADIYITNDSSMVSVSNGLLIGEDVTGGRKTYHWQTRYPTSTYLFALYSTGYSHFREKYTNINGREMELYYYVFPEKVEDAKFDFKVNTEAMRYFEEMFGEYPFIREKYGVAEFLWNRGAMEHQTITGMGSVFIGGRGFFKNILVHELAHHWWGNAVGPASWKDVWLNEGFATYSEALFWEQRSGFGGLQNSMQNYFNSIDGTTLYDPNTMFLFSRVVYNKGAWVLHMLRRRVGDEDFFKILRTYYNTYKYETAATSDFMRVCESVTGKSMRKFFEQWVYDGKGNIELDYDFTVTEVESGYEAKVYLKQVQSGYDVYEFPLDIAFEFEDGSRSTTFNETVDKEESTFTFILDSKPTTPVFDPDTWLLAEFFAMQKEE